MIEDLPAGVFPSLSHSGGYVCFGLANCTLGIDIEIHRPKRDLDVNAEWFMNRGELEHLTRQGAPDLKYFYRNWCAREAWYKSLTEDAQARIGIHEVNYSELLAGNCNCQLVQGASKAYQFAAVLSKAPSKIERQPYQIPPDKMPILTGQNPTVAKQ